MNSVISQMSQLAALYYYSELNDNTIMSLSNDFHYFFVAVIIVYEVK